MRILGTCKKVQNPVQKGGFFMADLSELELQNLRHLIMGYETSNGKMTAYANSSTDQEVKQFFQKSAQSAMETKQQLMKFLQ